jgi:hypothetical protein
METLLPALVYMAALDFAGINRAAQGPGQNPPRAPALSIRPGRKTCGNAPILLDFFVFSGRVPLLKISQGCIIVEHSREIHP